MKSRILRKSYLVVAVALFLTGISSEIVHANPQEMSSNQLVFSTPVNDELGPGFEPANEHEQIAPDTFFVSEGKIFVDDSVNNRIIVYENQEYSKEILLPWNMDAKLFYFEETKNELWVVYVDRNDASCEHYYLVKIDVLDGIISDTELELSNANEVFQEYYFDSNGNLQTQYVYLDDEGNPVADETIYKRKSSSVKLVNQGFPFTSYTPLARKASNYSSERTRILNCIGNDVYNLCSSYENSGESRVVKEFVMKNDEMIARPEYNINSFERGYYQVDDKGNVYQMQINETAVNIYKLCFYPFESLDDKDILVKEYFIEKASFTKNIRTTTNYETIAKLTVKTTMDYYYRNLTWTFNSARNANVSVTANSSLVELPGWLDDLDENQDNILTNIPYCWGDGLAILSCQR